MLIEKAKGEILGVVIVESGWGSILPTVIIANMMHAGPAERSGRLNIGDQIMSINGTSLVGLPLSTCQSIIKVHVWFYFFVTNIIKRQTEYGGTQEVLHLWLIVQQKHMWFLK